MNVKTRCPLFAAHVSTARIFPEANYQPSSLRAMMMMGWAAVAESNMSPSFVHLCCKLC